MKDQLTPKQAKFIKAKIAGHNNVDSAIQAGYSPKSANAQSSQLLKNPKVSRVLDKAGLTDKAIAEMLKVATTSGLGVKSTNSDALRGIELAYKLKGYLVQEKEDKAQTNVYINELRNLDMRELSLQLEQLQSDSTE